MPRVCVSKRQGAYPPARVTAFSPPNREGPRAAVPQGAVAAADQCGCPSVLSGGEGRDRPHSQAEAGREERRPARPLGPAAPSDPRRQISGWIGVAQHYRLSPLPSALLFQLIIDPAVGIDWIFLSVLLKSKAAHKASLITFGSQTAEPRPGRDGVCPRFLKLSLEMLGRNPRACAWHISHCQ